LTESEIPKKGSVYIGGPLIKPDWLSGRRIAVERVEVGEAPPRVAEVDLLVGGSSSPPILISVRVRRKGQIVTELVFLRNWDAKKLYGDPLRRRQPPGCRQSLQRGEMSTWHYLTCPFHGEVVQISRHRALPIDHGMGDNVSRMELISNFGARHFGCKLEVVNEHHDTPWSFRDCGGWYRKPDEFGDVPRARRPYVGNAAEAIWKFLQDRGLGDPGEQHVDPKKWGDEDSAPEGECGWSFQLEDDDPLSYVREDLSIIWNGSSIEEDIVQEKMIPSWSKGPCHLCGSEMWQTRADPRPTSDKIICRECEQYARGVKDGLKNGLSYDPPLALTFKKLDERAQAPVVATGGAAGIDLRTIEDVTIIPGKVATIRTGLAVMLPKGHVGQIWPRSGLAARSGVDTLAGVIDEDYRGEIKVLLTILAGEKAITVRQGDRIAQILIVPVAKMSILEGDLNDTERGTSGFGSTGLE
tara:strand:+ start:782 stop:2188 length:1407 start_codon:yes stop_codon:yes gene_type:complete